MHDERHAVLAAKVDLQDERDSGSWRFITIRNEIFAIVTDCVFADDRVEQVLDEGLIEFHFVMGAPGELSLSMSGPDGRKFGEASLIACRNGQDVDYSIHYPAGPASVVSLYVEPSLLRDSFGFGDSVVADVRKLLDPQPGTLTVVEQRIDPDTVAVLMNLRAIDFDGPRDLMLATAKIYELIYLITSALCSRRDIDDPSVVFTKRELLMFERAKEILARDLERSLTLNELARELGTNATKLKSGFKLLYGTTIFSYRLRFRMDHAIRLLVDRNLPISQVAKAVGYERQASFTSAFKAHFGFLPKSARRPHFSPMAEMPNR